MVSTGFSDDIGSWKIIAMRLPRTSRMSASLSCSRSRPSNSTEPPAMRPGGLCTSRNSESALTLLPHPLSPTSPTVSPSWMS